MCFFLASKRVEKDIFQMVDELKFGFQFKVFVTKLHRNFKICKTSHIFPKEYFGKWYLPFKTKSQNFCIPISVVTHSVLIISSSSLVF